MPDEAQVPCRPTPDVGRRRLGRFARQSQFADEDKAETASPRGGDPAMRNKANSPDRLLCETKPIAGLGRRGRRGRLCETKPICVSGSEVCQIRRHHVKQSQFCWVTRSRGRAKQSQSAGPGCHERRGGCAKQSRFQGTDSRLKGTGNAGGSYAKQSQLTRRQMAGTAYEACPTKPSAKQSQFDLPNKRWPGSPYRMAPALAVRNKANEANDSQKKALEYPLKT